MSATKPPAGYDDRFVVPLEPNRRGAHRARVSPLVGALPVLAVVAVVVAVIVLAWTLFGHSTTDSAANAGASGGATQSAAPTTPGSTVSTPSTQPSDTATATHSATATKTSSVSRTATVTVMNSTNRAGLAGRVAGLLNGKGWTGAHLSKTAVAPRLTTVYYATTEQKAVAEALVADLGVGTIKRSTTMAANGIVVVVGTDYP